MDLSLNMRATEAEAASAVAGAAMDRLLDMHAMEAEAVSAVADATQAMDGVGLGLLIANL